MREVSRSRKMRSPHFSVGLGDWELTMVAVGREGGWSWGGSGLEPEQGYKRSVSGSKGGPVRLFVIDHQTMTHLFGSTGILVAAEPSPGFRRATLFCTQLQSITEIITSSMSPEGFHAPMVTTRSPPTSPSSRFASVMITPLALPIHILYPRSPPPPSSRAFTDNCRLS